MRNLISLKWLCMKLLKRMYPVTSYGNPQIYPLIHGSALEKRNMGQESSDSCGPGVTTSVSHRNDAKTGVSQSRCVLWVRDEKLLFFLCSVSIVSFFLRAGTFAYHCLFAFRFCGSFPGGSAGRETACHAGDLDSIPWRRERLPTPVLPVDIFIT